MKPDNLMEHPEGGRFKEVFRSCEKVKTERGERSALTHIYFSLNEGEMSRFHKVVSDEVWNLYQGEGLIIYTWDESNTQPQRTILSADKNRFCHVVPAGIWQAAISLFGRVLVGCSVGPGFEFDDFTLMEPGSHEAQKLIAVAPESKPLVTGISGGE
ncbi:MAG: cupin domain-containing protein [Desulfobacterales bacterium]|nr:cupin domain-containing protein [Desulfobacterales bacterium]